MERLKQHKLTLPLNKKRLGSRHIYLVVILLMLFVQVAAQENNDRVAELIKQLKSPNAFDRQSAAEALGDIGPEAKQAIPALIEALKDESEDVREAAAQTIEHLKSV